MTITDAKPKPRSRRGRPRRLTAEQVVDAALQLGLDGLTMTRVAEHLGVSITVLYSYVGSREDLIRLAAALAARRQSFPKDIGRHWTGHAIAYARALYQLLSGDPQLIESYMRGRIGPEVEVDHAETWLRAMSQWGFPPEEALHLLRSVGLVVMGAAVNEVHDRSLKLDGASYSERARQVVRDRSDELPLLGDQVEGFARETPLSSWEETLLMLLRGVAAKRGEPFDPAIIETISKNP
jgi:AcrR family transcriptional regulator